MRGLQYILLVGMILGSCQSRTDYQQEGAQLIKRLRQLHCLQQGLELETRNMWDSLALELDAQLPASMPAAERQNMLTVKNVNLIQMFESYDLLADTTKALVQLTGQRDEGIVQAILELKKERDTIKAQERALLLTIEQEDEQELAAFRKQLESQTQAPCQ
ncbi:MAG: hypothetical protein HRU41_29465 [Saprospiraceae bacterium]|nr:hypothetical protein [Saprospiraceae bacterium]